MTSTHLNHDRSRFNTDVAGSRLLCSRHQIVQLFRRFIREDRPVSAQYGDENRMMVTRALRLNSTFSRLYFEYGDHKAGNSEMLRSQQVQFSVEDGPGKSQFISPRIRDVLLDGTPVFHVPIPERVIQVDRRTHERIEIPKFSAPIVIFHLPDGRRVEGRLADMSAGGIGVVGFAEDLNVPTGTVIRNCLIQLAGNENVSVDVEIRYTRGYIDAQGRSVRRIGFKLVSRPKEFSELLNSFTVEL
jgi:c-di-GMP-binding flagellar brake protein YcgR